MIDISDLRKVYPTRSGEIVALDGIDLHVPSGAILGIVGESGAGKSTLVRCLAMLDRPTSGQITVNSVELTAASTKQLRSARSRIGMVFQHVNLLDNRTAAGNIGYPLEIAGVPTAERARRVQELLELVGLGDRGDSYPAQLSGGQKQRVGIARALATDPDVLLCDEPTSALDPGTTREILVLLGDLRDRLGVTIVIITHEMAVVKQICDHVAVLRAGRIEVSGPLLEVIEDSSNGVAASLLPLPARPRTLQAEAPEILVTFSTATAQTTFLSSVIRRFDIDIEVLAGSVEPVQGSTLGRLRLGLPAGTNALPVIDHLAELGIWAEVA